MIPIKALVYCMNNSNINVSNVYEKISPFLQIIYQIKLWPYCLNVLMFLIVN